MSTAPRFVCNVHRKCSDVVLLCAGASRSHLMALLQPKGKALPQKNWAELQREGWDPRSVESLGMVDKETLKNLTRTFNRAVSVEDACDGDSDPHNIFRSSSDGSADVRSKKPQRRYVVHGTAEGKSVAGVWTTEPEPDDDEVATRKLLQGIPSDGSNFFDHPHESHDFVRAHNAHAHARASPVDEGLHANMEHAAGNRLKVIRLDDAGAAERATGPSGSRGSSSSHSPAQGVRASVCAGHRSRA